MSKSGLRSKTHVKTKKINQRRKQKRKYQERIKSEEHSGVSVILGKLEKNPCCPHGPTLLFSKMVKSNTKNFYACAAQRDRKFCSFYLPEGEVLRNSDFWKQGSLHFLKGINHRKLFLIANEVRLLKSSERIFCVTCSILVLPKLVSHHEQHKLIQGITDHNFENPTDILPPCEVDKSEAQYWFSKSAVNDIVRIFKSLNYRFDQFCFGLFITNCFFLPGMLFVLGHQEFMNS